MQENGNLFTHHVEATVVLVPCSHKLFFSDDDIDQYPVHYQRIMSSQEEWVGLQVCFP